MEFHKIHLLQNYSSFQLIEEGYSEDEKWCVDQKYLLRLSSNTDLQQLKNQAELTNKVHKLDDNIPCVYEVGVLKDRSYVILDYIKGENGETKLPTLSKKVQYQVGIQVGETLRKMHSITAPPNTPCWEEVWTKRIIKLTPQFLPIVEANPDYNCILPFIDSQIHLLKGRPSCIQHYDFHTGNILIDDEKFSGLIDMQKIRYADPVNEFYKLEYFNVQVSKSYSKGVLDGYHKQGEIPSSFWELHRFYAAVHLISAEVWGHQVAIKQKEKFQAFTRFTLDQFNNFQLLIPKWYTDQ